MLRRRAIKRKILVFISLFIISGYHLLIHVTENLAYLPRITEKKDTILEISDFRVSNFNGQKFFKNI